MNIKHMERFFPFLASCKIRKQKIGCLYLYVHIISRLRQSITAYLKSVFGIFEVRSAKFLSFLVSPIHLYDDSLQAGKKNQKMV